MNRKTYYITADAACFFTPVQVAERIGLFDNIEQSANSPYEVVCDYPDIDARGTLNLETGEFQYVDEDGDEQSEWIYGETDLRNMLEAYSIVWCHDSSSGVVLYVER